MNIQTHAKRIVTVGLVAALSGAALPLTALAEANAGAEAQTAAVEEVAEQGTEAEKTVEAETTATTEVTATDAETTAAIEDATTQEAPAAEKDAEPASADDAPADANSAPATRSTDYELFIEGLGNANYSDTTVMSTTATAQIKAFYQEWDSETATSTTVYPDVTWTTSDSSLLTVDADGTLHAQGKSGEVAVRATTEDGVSVTAGISIMSAQEYADYFASSLRDNVVLSDGTLYVGTPEGGGYALGCTPDALGFDSAYTEQSVTATSSNPAAVSAIVEHASYGTTVSITPVDYGEADVTIRLAFKTSDGDTAAATVTLPCNVADDGNSQRGEIIENYSALDLALSLRDIVNQPWLDTVVSTPTEDGCSLVLEGKAASLAYNQMNSGLSFNYPQVDSGVELVSVESTDTNVVRAKTFGSGIVGGGLWGSLQFVGHGTADVWFTYKITNAGGTTSTTVRTAHITVPESYPLPAGTTQAKLEIAGLEPQGSGNVSYAAATISGQLSVTEREQESQITTFSLADAADPAYTWTSSDPALMTVDENGNVRGQGKAGRVVITATDAEGNTAQRAFVLLAAEQVTPTVTLSGATANADGTYSLVIDGSYTGDGLVAVDLGGVYGFDAAYAAANVRLASSDASVVSVAGGKIVPVGHGTANVVAYVPVRDASSGTESVVTATIHVTVDESYRLPAGGGQGSGDQTDDTTTKPAGTTTPTDKKDPAAEKNDDLLPKTGDPTSSATLLAAVLGAGGLGASTLLRRRRE